MKVREKHKHKRWSQYHYNVIAKEIRELFPLDGINAEYPERQENTLIRTTLSALALSLCNRFKEDADTAEDPGWGFDPIKFLDACSSNTDLYPLSELWDD